MHRYLWGSIIAGFSQVAFIYWNLWSPSGVGPAHTFLHLLQYAGIAAGSTAILCFARAIRRQAPGRRTIRGSATVAMGFSAAAAALLLAAIALSLVQSPTEADLYAFGLMAAELTWFTLVVLGLAAIAAPPRPVMPAIMLGVLVLAGTVHAVPLPYNLAGPSGEPDTSYLIRVEGGERHPGRIYGLTVWSGTATLADYLYSLGSRSTVLLPASEARPAMAQDATALELMLVDSEAMAKAVGLQLVGRGKGALPSGNGVVVTRISAGSPAAAIFDPGDIIVGFNGEAIATWADLVDMLQAARPGAEVTFSIRRGAEPQTVKLTTMPNPSNPERAMVGILGSDHMHYDIPVTINSTIPKDIAGPSMGLALTLQVVDQTTPGGVTNGWRVAATGTILPGGQVGAVGGVGYKVLGAERTGADVLFVPRANYEEALAGATKIRVVPVDTAQEALAWLKEHQP
ncbi:MAG TPA: PDZ domain-containing protein [Symbiobacteriaceae bacterium]|nr:PDZ domain-containing protein [Symbiobacteriaceae bacterium]